MNGKQLFIKEKAVKPMPIKDVHKIHSKNLPPKGVLNS